MTATVVIGPKTRLGQAVLAELDSSHVLAVARDAQDVPAVTALGVSPDVVVDAASGTLADRVASLGEGPVRLVIAALGPVHPTEPEFTADLASVQRDLAYVDQVLGCGRPVQVVFVSTVIALAPGDDRRYYGGWKCLLEQLLDQRIAQTDDQHSSLAVLYPGRLRPAHGGKPWHRLHASYSGVSRLALAYDLEVNARRTVGVDSRIWLAVRSISFALRSLSLSTRRHRSALGGARHRGTTGTDTRE